MSIFLLDPADNGGHGRERDVDGLACGGDELAVGRQGEGVEGQGNSLVGQVRGRLASTLDVLWWRWGVSGCVECTKDE